jgi:hypothetical protein
MQVKIERFGGASRDRKARDSENRQVINLSRILQRPQRLKRPQGRIYCPLYGGLANRTLQLIRRPVLPPVTNTAFAFIGLGITFFLHDMTDRSGPKWEKLRGTVCKILATHLN